MRLVSPVWSAGFVGGGRRARYRFAEAVGDVARGQPAAAG
jgi:hypothetical protein